MSRHPLRRLFAILFAVVLLSAPARIMPVVAVPMDMDMTAGMAMAAQDGNSDSAPTPCKGMAPGCMTELGCVFMIGVPIPIPQITVKLAWVPVSYAWPSAMLDEGRIRIPDLRPPIRLI